MGESLRGLLRFARNDGLRHCEAIIDVTAKPVGPWQSRLSHLNDHLDGN